VRCYYCEPDHLYRAAYFLFLLPVLHPPFARRRQRRQRQFSPPVVQQRPQLLRRPDHLAGPAPVRGIVITCDARTNGGARRPAGAAVCPLRLARRRAAGPAQQAPDHAVQRNHVGPGAGQRRRRLLVRRAVDALVIYSGIHHRHGLRCRRRRRTGVPDVPGGPRRFDRCAIKICCHRIGFAPDRPRPGRRAGASHVGARRHPVHGLRLSGVRLQSARHERARSAACTVRQARLARHRRRLAVCLARTAAARPGLGRRHLALPVLRQHGLDGAICHARPGHESWRAGHDADARWRRRAAERLHRQAIDAPLWRRPHHSDRTGVHLGLLCPDAHHPRLTIRQCGRQCRGVCRADVLF